MRLAYHCGQCFEEHKRFKRPYKVIEIADSPNKRCPTHNRILHDVYVDSEGKEHTLDRWDVSVFREILQDLTGEIDRNRELYARIESRLTELEGKE